MLGLPELFRQFATARMLVFGAVMVAMMIFRTEGILPPASETTTTTSAETTLTTAGG